MSGNILFGLARIAYHGGGLVYLSRSPRQVWYEKKRVLDVFCGVECHGFVRSVDGGKTWYPIVISRSDSAFADYRYADTGLLVSLACDARRQEPLRRASDTSVASEVALSD